MYNFFHLSTCISTKNALVKDRWAPLKTVISLTNIVDKNTKPI